MPKRSISPGEDTPRALDPPKRARPSTSVTLKNTEYTVGWISAIPIEYVAAQAFLEEEHGRPQYIPDQNDYNFGRIGEHNVVMTVLPAYGTVPAAIVARDMLSSFPNIRIRLMVGIGGGAPSAEHDIRLGDVVVSTPQAGYGGVFEYDFGKTIQQRAFQTTGFLNQPPMFLQAAVHGLRAHYEKDGHCLHETVNRVLERNPRLREGYSRPPLATDRLYQSTVAHIVEGDCCETVCSFRPSNLISRPERKAEDSPTIHHGIIASANQVMKDAIIRDRLAAEKNVLCFEMEAAGLMNHFSCLVIRGICDYSDSHKNKQWQGYAAMTAAAYASDLVSRLPANPTGPVMESREDKKENIARQRLDFLDSLRFDQIDARQANIKNAHSKTCKWLLTHPDYASWLDPGQLNKHNGFLWIKGKPGTGKSTLMKFAFNHASETMSDKILLSFFFNARGGSLERSTLGLYRSLLLQLLDHPIVEKYPWEHLGLATPKKRSHQWSVETLKLYFENTAQKIKDSSFLCFIDALDECDESHVRDMVSFFENLAELSKSSGIQFRVCFSSRHYPHITIARGVHLVLERQKGHEHDIDGYLDSELRIGQSSCAKQVRVDLQKRASGVFMWVVLAVAILNKEYDRGRVHALPRRLQEMPGDLHQLFHDILTRESGGEDELLLCIQWVLFAQRPLKPQELYFAILSALEPASISKWDVDEVSPADIRRFILSSSKGLIEVIESPIPTVQFIHESVKDFLLKENGLRDIGSSLGVNLLGESHERLKQSCLAYIDCLAKDELLPRISSLRVNNSKVRIALDQGFPFLGYAVEYALYHADAAEEGGVSQTNFLKTFQFGTWVRLSLVFEEYKERKHTINASLLYILALHDLANLIRIHPKSFSCFEVEDDGYGTPMFAALATHSTKAVAAFLVALAQGDQAKSKGTSNVELRRIYERYIAQPDQWDTFDSRFLFSHYKGVLGHLSQQGNEDMILAYLLSRPLSISMAHPHDHMLMLRASAYGYEAIVKLLLDHGVRPDYGRPLLNAVEYGYESIVKMLLDKGTDPNSCGIRTARPLSLAVEKSHNEIVQLLLEKGADPNSRNLCGETPLSSAIQMGQGDIIKALLAHGADPNAADSTGMVPLALAVEGGNEPIVKLLLDYGATACPRGCGSVIPLLLAARRGHEELVKVLLRHGADIQAKDEYGRTALSLACQGGLESIVRLLLRNGARRSTIDVFGMTPLSLATDAGHEGIIKLLETLPIP